MGDKIEYEYAEMVTGFFNRGVNTPVKTSMYVRDILGETVTPDYSEDSLGALILMGAQGWRLMTTRISSSGRMGWVATTMKDPNIVWEKYTAEEGVFVEQRLLTIMAALEHYWWAFARDKEIPIAPDFAGQDGEAARQLRGLLTTASISLELPTHQSELSAYAGDHNLRDVSHVLTYVRNRLTHPKRPNRSTRAQVWLVKPLASRADAWTSYSCGSSAIQAMHAMARGWTGG